MSSNQKEKKVREWNIAESKSSRDEVFVIIS